MCEVLENIEEYERTKKRWTYFHCIHHYFSCTYDCSTGWLIQISTYTILINAVILFFDNSSGVSTCPSG